jgi:hypothetical protein
MTKPHRELLVENEKLEAEIVALKEEKGIKCKYHGSKMLYCSTCVEQIYAQGWRKEVIFYKTISRLQDAMLKYLDEQIEPLEMSNERFGDWFNKSIVRQLKQLENPAPAPDSKTEKN